MKFFTDPVQVTFTALSKTFNVSSVFCEIDLPFLANPITIKWYGVIIAFGFTLAVLFGGRKAYVWKIDIYKMLDILIWGALFGILGARLYYVFNEWGYYSAHPSEILAVWHGGLAIYGGLIGGILAALVVCITERVNIRNLLDLCGMSFLLGQGIGRWGNFANQEAFGTNTDLPWGMFSEKTQAYLQTLVNAGETGIEPSKPVHPTFLYESIWCIIGFFVLWWICEKHRRFSGQIFLTYGVWYGLERSIVEGLRTDSLYIGSTNIRISQALSMVLVVVCGTLLIIGLVRDKKHHKPIEGVDYFVEIPVYNKKRLCLEAKKEMILAQNEVLHYITLIELSDSEKEKKTLNKKLDKAKAVFKKKLSEYEKAKAASDAKDAKKAAKQAAK
jgi:phosphatidylglycerol---prolipoprotein diacylglyceryl transferase